MDTPGQLHHPPPSLGALLLDQVRQRGHQPLMTFYGGSERTELSYATFDNWASKTANLLAEELRAGPGSRIALGVADHWTGAVVLAAAWKLGAVVVPADNGSADVLVVAEDDATGAAGHPGLVVIGAGMGGRVTGDVAGLAFGDEVLAFGDDYDDATVTLDAIAFAAGDGAQTQAEQLRTAWGLLDAGDRLLVTASFDSASAVTLGLLAPIAAGAALVWCPGLDHDDAAAQASAERVTHLLDGPAIRPA